MMRSGREERFFEKEEIFERWGLGSGYEALMYIHIYHSP